MLRNLLVVTVLVNLGLCLQIGATTYYVSPDGENSYNGLSPDSAWRNVYYATLQVGNNPTDHDTVLVYPGLYDMEAGEFFPVRVRSYTTLVGLDTGVVLSAADTANVEVIRIKRHCVVQIENLEITAGDGGINAQTCSKLIIKDNYIHHNQRRSLLDNPFGGGIAVLGSGEVTIKGNLISENEISQTKAVYGGGGLGVFQSILVTIDSNTVSSNTVEYAGMACGGGMALAECDLVNITDNTIDSNLVKSITDKAESSGGGLYLTGCRELLIQGNSIRENALYRWTPQDTCLSHGGGIYIVDGSGQATLRGNLISGNYSIGNCEFARGDGGGVKVDNVSATFIDNTIVGNEAEYGIGADGWGGGVCVDSQSVCSFSGNRIYGNRAGSGGGIGVYFPDSLMVGGSPGHGNDLYDNVAERGDDLWRYYYAPPETIIATFNYFGGEPNENRVYPFEYWDVGFWRDNRIDENEPPHILEYFPTFVETMLNIGDTLLFWVEVLDYDGDSTLTSWLLDGEHLADGDSFLFIADSQYAGDDTLRAAVTDFEDTTSHYWYMQVGPISVPFGEGDKNLPEQFALLENYPNPFNASTVIRYQLPRSCHVRLEIFDILGRKVTALVDEKQKAGYKVAIWNGKEAASGFYFYKLTAGDFSETKKMIILR